jgi:hypothetical protein
MNENRKILLAGLSALVLMSGCASLNDNVKQPQGDKVVLANFDSMLEVNDFDGALFGQWDGFPDDLSQKCEIGFQAPGMDGKGYCLRIKYNVDSGKVAYNGFWMQFKKLEFKEFGKLTFWAKGDAGTHFPKEIRVELKNEKKKTFQKVVSGLEEDWKKFEIDLTGSSFLGEWEYLTEFVIVFSKDDIDSLRGTIYVDDIALEK